MKYYKTDNYECTIWRTDGEHWWFYYDDEWVVWNLSHPYNYIKITEEAFLEII